MKDIPNYQKLYAVTEDGQVWSYRKNDFLIPTLNEQGYYKVTLFDNNSRKKCIYIAGWQQSGSSSGSYPEGHGFESHTRHLRIHLRFYGYISVKENGVAYIWAKRGCAFGGFLQRKILPTNRADDQPAVLVNTRPQLKGT